MRLVLVSAVLCLAHCLARLHEPLSDEHPFLENDVVVPEEETQVNSYHLIHPAEAVLQEGNPADHEPSVALSVESRTHRPLKSRTIEQLHAIESMFRHVRQRMLQGAPWSVTAARIGVILAEIQNAEQRLENERIDSQRIIDTNYRVLRHMNIEQRGVQIPRLKRSMQSLKSWISSFNRVAHTWEESAIAYHTALVSYVTNSANAKKTCCERNRAGKLQVLNLPTTATCDVRGTSAAVCTTAAEKEVKDVITNRVNTAVDQFQRLDKLCVGLQESLQAQRRELKLKSQACAALAAAGIAQNRTGPLAGPGQLGSLTELQAALRQDPYTLQYTKMVHRYNQECTEHQAAQEQRNKQLLRIEIIECAIQHYQQGGFDTVRDETVVTKCQAHVMKANVLRHLAIRPPPHRVNMSMSLFVDPVVDVRQFAPCGADTIPQQESFTCNIPGSVVQECKHHHLDLHPP